MCFCIENRIRSTTCAVMKVEPSKIDRKWDFQIWDRVMRITMEDLIPFLRLYETKLKSSCCSAVKMF